MVPARTLNGLVNSRICLTLVVVALVATGCKPQAPATHTTAPTTQSAPAARADSAESLQADFDTWQRKRRDELMAPDGYLSLVARSWLKPGSTVTVGSAKETGIHTDAGPAQLAAVTFKDGKVMVTPAAGQTFQVAGHPTTTPFELPIKDADGKPVMVGFDDGKGSMALVTHKDEVGLRVRHAEAATRTGFAGLQTWPLSRDWQVRAKFIPHATGQKLAFVNVLGLTDEMPNPGAVEFTWQGKLYRLEAFDDGVPGQLFFVFGDKTNGKGSYGGGRFMEVPAADANGGVLLDFNRAYNPPCAYTAYAMCPLPPAENRLPFAIESGEKAPAKPAPHPV